MIVRICVALEHVSRRQVNSVNVVLGALERVLRESAAHPTAFGSDDDDKVSSLTQEVTKALGRTNETLKRLRRSTEVGRRHSGLERRLASNLVAGMANRLREAAEKFGTIQGAHLKRKRKCGISIYSAC